MAKRPTAAEAESEKAPDDTSPQAEELVKEKSGSEEKEDENKDEDEESEAEVEEAAKNTKEQDEEDEKDQDEKEDASTNVKEKEEKQVQEPIQECMREEIQVKEPKKRRQKPDDKKDSEPKRAKPSLLRKKPAAARKRPAAAAVAAAEQQDARKETSSASYSPVFADDGSLSEEVCLADAPRQRRRICAPWRLSERRPQGGGQSGPARFGTTGLARHEGQHLRVGRQEEDEDEARREGDGGGQLGFGQLLELSEHEFEQRPLLQKEEEASAASQAGSIGVDHERCLGRAEPRHSNDALQVAGRLVASPGGGPWGVCCAVPVRRAARPPHRPALFDTGLVEGGGAALGSGTLDKVRLFPVHCVWPVGFGPSAMIAQGVADMCVERCGAPAHQRNGGRDLPPMELSTEKWVARTRCARCGHRPRGRTMCPRCYYRVGPCCWNIQRQCCMICAAEPEPEPEPAQRAPTGWDDYLQDKLEHEDWQDSCMEEDFAQRAERDNVADNGLEAEEEILAMAWRHECPVVVDSMCTECCSSQVGGSMFVLGKCA